MEQAISRAEDRLSSLSQAVSFYTAAHKTANAKAPSFLDANIRDVLVECRALFFAVQDLRVKLYADGAPPPHVQRELYEASAHMRFIICAYRDLQDSLSREDSFFWLFISLTKPRFTSQLRILMREGPKILGDALAQIVEEDRRAKEGWDLAVRLDPSLAEAANFNTSNCDTSQFIPADVTRVPRRSA